MLDSNNLDLKLVEFCNKPMLTPAELVAHLKSKGVTFNLCAEEDAIVYLRDANNFLRTGSYRKLFDYQTEGKHIGDYVNVDFGYLIELSSLDRKLRETMLGIAIDIEHFAKIDILRYAEKHKEDGYEIATDYLEQLSRDVRSRIINNFMIRSSGNAHKDEYTGDLISHYLNKMPLWVFLEVIEFGRFVDFYRFCSERWKDQHMHSSHYVLKSVKSLRNACAHNNCIVNGLTASGEKARFSTPRSVFDTLNAASLKNTKSRRKKLRNLRIAQLADTLQADSQFCTLSTTKERHLTALQTLKTATIRCKEITAQGSASLTSYLEFIVALLDTFTYNRA